MASGRFGGDFNVDNYKYEQRRGIISMNEEEATIMEETGLL